MTPNPQHIRSLPPSSDEALARALREVAVERDRYRRALETIRKIVLQEDCPISGRLAAVLIATQVIIRPPTRTWRDRLQGWQQTWVARVRAWRRG